ncbi:hypothetical protein [Rhodohalobacter barkolensis]|uniref:Uncharacterized protein n=1 Tax=Rhodohalobacter barkolensis TaxID=2053187 RepID=A0A2N0VKN8_9BACT|nr:hypothetical protein [Rhodohalobacter barkolensis]PKD44765.1 hypothetical protein CWD77_04690 [Rhodohalobacter barkolensis]
MNNPIHVEKLYRKLTRELDSHQSIRHRYTLIRYFIQQIEGDYNRYESYLIQLAEKLPVYSSFVTYCGLDPAILESDIEIFLELADKFEDIWKSENFRKAVERLKVVCLIQYICVEEMEKLSQLLFNWYKIKEPLIVKIEFRTDSEYLLNISKLLKGRVADINNKDNSIVKSLIGELDQLLKSEADSIFVPTVEIYKHSEFGMIEYGRLRNLNVQIVRSSSEGYDKIFRRYPVIGIEQAEWPESRKISEAARSLISNNKKVSDGKYYNGHAQYQTNIAFHDGESANAAIALLWFVGLQRKSNQRERYELQPDLCITGNVDSAGNLLPVDSEGVDAKVRAAFFSMINFMVVPASQYFQFIEAIDKLKRKYPNRDLIVISVKNLNELLYDRRLTQHINPSKITHIVKQAWQRRYEGVGISVIVILVLIIFRLIYGPLDQRPVSGEFEGTLLKVKNESGVIIDRIEVGAHTVATEQKNITTDHSLVTFWKSQNNYSIIWGETGASQNLSISGGLLKKKQVNRQDPDWVKTLSYDLQFPNKPEIINGIYLPKKLLSVGQIVESEESKLIAVVNHAPYFPGLLSVRDPKTGIELSHFVNTGRIHDAIILDPGGGSKKIAFSGVNNAFDMAFVALLDIDNITGHSPLNDEYNLLDYSLNESIEYILIPKTIVGQSVLSDRKYNIAERLRYFPESGVLEVYVTDYEQYKRDTVELPASRSNVYYYFNDDLSLRGVGTSDGYDLTADYLYSKGIIDQNPDYRYFENYQDRLLYWKGDEFVSFEEFSGTY